MKLLAAWLAMAAALLLAAPAFAALTFPPLSGRVVDQAHVLSPQAQAELTAKLAALEQKTSRQLVVVTLPSLQGDDIEDYGNKLLRTWGLGQKATNNGVLFIIVPSEHKVRIEVGYGLEGQFTDALSSVILQRSVIPKFRAGDVQGGVVAGTDEIITQLGLDASTAEARAAQAAQSLSRPQGRIGNPLGGIVPILLIIFIGFHLLRGRGGAGGGGGGLAWLLPMMILGSSRGGWGGGGGGFGGGDFGGGGGGFGGGGGSGGGGGASGGW